MDGVFVLGSSRPCAPFDMHENCRSFCSFALLGGRQRENFYQWLFDGDHVAYERDFP